MSEKVLGFKEKELKKFMQFVWYYQPKGRRNWKTLCLKEWAEKQAGEKQ